MDANNTSLTGTSVPDDAKGPTSAPIEPNPPASNESNNESNNVTSTSTNTEDEHMMDTTPNETDIKTATTIKKSNVTKDTQASPDKKSFKEKEMIDLRVDGPRMSTSAAAPMSNQLEFFHMLMKVFCPNLEMGRITHSNPNDNIENCKDEKPGELIISFYGI